MKFSAMLLILVAFVLSGMCVHIDYEYDKYFPEWFRHIYMAVFIFSFAMLIAVRW